MTKNYFLRVNELTPTRLWINNPTPEEAKKAISAGAISCTTNPTYCMKQIQNNTEKSNVFKIIDRVLHETNDDDKAADLIQQKMVKRILDIFLPLYEINPLKEGFVSIQGNPLFDDNKDMIIKEALSYRNLGKNFITKIPATKAGLEALEELIPMNVPMIATEIMGISQMIYTCEMYKKISKKSGKYPPLYITHITGIFDEYLEKVSKREAVDIATDIIWQAGAIVARKQYKIFKERKYPGIMLGGGARGLHHFTEMVGSEMHITINWKRAADKLIETNPPVVYKMFNPSPQKVIDELLDKFPVFKKAYNEDGLSIKEFKDFEPVNHFREQFIEGWEFLLNTIKKRRKGSKI